MRLISFELILQALKEQGLYETYLVLERLFQEEPLVVVNQEGDAIISFFDEEEMFCYLEHLQDTMEEL